MKHQTGGPSAITRVLLAGVVVLQFGACGGGDGGGSNFCSAVLDAMDRCEILEQNGDLGLVNGPGYCRPYPPSDFNDCISGCYDEVQCDGFIGFVCEGFIPDDLSACLDDCNSTPFVCQNGSDIPTQWICDLDDDCGDGSDEAGCEYFFVCQDNEDIPWAYRCDGFVDCADGTDEIGCAETSCVNLDASAVGTRSTDAASAAPGDYTHQAASRKGPTSDSSAD